jgi:hypothetical protein
VIRAPNELAEHETLSFSKCDEQIRTMFVMGRPKASDASEEQFLVHIDLAVGTSVGAFTFRVAPVGIALPCPVVLGIGPTDVTILRDRRDTVKTFDHDLVVHTKPSRRHSSVAKI